MLGFSSKIELVSCYQDLQFFCFQITNGPTFTINLTGTGIQPGLNFSFVRHDFGPCFLYRAGMPLKRTTLIIKNEDTKDIRLAVFTLLIYPPFINVVFYQEQLTCRLVWASSGFQVSTVQKHHSNITVNKKQRRWLINENPVSYKLHTPNLGTKIILLFQIQSNNCSTTIFPNTFWPLVLMSW